MVADVIYGGDESLNALIYKPLDRGTSEYLQRHLDTTLGSIKNLSSRFTSAVRGLYDRFHGEDVLLRAKLALMSAGKHLNQDVIYPVRYHTYRDINLMMQRYVMSNEEVSNLYKRNKCYGFKDTYIDPEPSVHGKERVDYQRVMDGVLQFEEESGEGYFCYYTNSMDEEEELSALDKISVLDTWDVVARLIAEGADPTHTELEDL